MAHSNWKKTEKTQPVVHMANSVYIDPAECDSTVSCKIVTTSYGRLEGNVSLSDCGEKIDWYFSNDDSSVEKIDKAINAMREFRKAFVTARKSHPKPDES